MTNPPPPMYPQMSSFTIPHTTPTPATSAPASSTGTFSANPSSATVNVQTFTVPLGAQPATTGQSIQYAQTYAPQSHPHYPTMPYYYPPPYAATSYMPIPSASPSAPPVAQAVMADGIGNQGPWTNEEQERLKQLAEQSRSADKSGDIDWDWVVQQWGGNRTRHVLRRLS